MKKSSLFTALFLVSSLYAHNSVEEALDEGAEHPIARVPAYEKKESSHVVISGHYRGRIDSYHGVNKVAYGDESIDAKGKVRGNADDTIYLQQIIAGVTYRPDQDWELKAYMYDARSWGSSLDAGDFIKNKNTKDSYLMSYYDDHFELFETYIRRHHFFNKHLTFTLGRQQLGYGDRRMFGPGKWGNTMGWLWDAGHLSYKNAQDYIDLWYGQTRIKNPNDFSITKKHRYQGVGLYSHFDMAYGMALEPLAAWRNNLYSRVTPEQNFYYGGFRAYKLDKAFIFDVTGVKEYGSYGTQNVDAYAYVIKGGYRAKKILDTTLTLGYVYASGDSDADDGTKETFFAPFGANDGLHYGRMDVMVWANMSDIQMKFSFKPIKKLKVQFEYHHFNLANANDKWYFFAYKNKEGNHFTHIGDESDLIMKYRVNKHLDLLAIGAYLKAGNFISGNQIALNDASKLFLQFMYKF